MSRKKQHKSRVYLLVGEPGPGACAVGYVRYSSDMQRAASIVTQKRSIQALADRKGWVIVAWYEEPEQSAKADEIEQRPQFAALLRAAGTQFHAVLCYDTSRWSRNVAATRASLNLLRRKGVWWQTAEEQWTIDNIQEPGLGIGFGLAAQQAEDYVVQLSKRTIEGKEDRARDGYHNGSVPFGYLPPEYPQRPPHAPSIWRPPRVAASPDPETFPALIKLGELAAQGWSDQAIADALVDAHSTTARFGERPLTKDTVAAIRRLWFPREFAPSSGHGTIETPSGELVEGRHPAAWPYELWQRMVEAKAGQYHRPAAGVEVQRRAHEFSRVIVCAGCRRPLRVSPSKSVPYYKDTSSVRKLPCPHFGCVSVKAATVVRQFGGLLASVTLPSHWREAVAARCEEAVGKGDEAGRRAQARRAELEAEQKRLVTAFTKGYLAEADLDAQVERLRAELATLPLPTLRDASECTEAAIAAGETLADMAGYWAEASCEERRDMVWALLQLGGLVYDLEHQVIIGLMPRHDMLPVLSLALEAEWEQRGDDGLWLHEAHRQAHAARRPLQMLQAEPPFRAHTLSPAQRKEALDLLRAGQTPQRVANHFGVSYWVILRLLRRTAPTLLAAHQQPALSAAQAEEARALVAAGWSLRKVGKQFGVSYGAIWRLLQRDRRVDPPRQSEGTNGTRGGGMG
jgi:site-specific DNA recombinase